jgi:translation initiation factor IF-2
VRRAKTEAASETEAGDIFGALDGEGARELRVVLKADVHGTMEAVREGISSLATDRVSVKIIHTGVGGISESDVMLASASNAVIAGFHVRPEAAARKAAEREQVEIRCFDIIYELFDDMKLMMGGLLPPKVVETIVGHARVKELFPIPKLGTIIGCQIDEGSIKRNNPIRVMRDGVPVYTGKIESLRRFRDDVREVNAPLECGVRIENFNDVKVGDILESLQVEERPDSL